MTNEAKRNEDTVEPMVREVHNVDRVPYREMSEAARGILDVHWRAVEWYSRDARAWVPNPVCPRQWNEEAYRVPPSVFPNNRAVRTGGPSRDDSTHEPVVGRSEDA